MVVQNLVEPGASGNARGMLEAGALSADSPWPGMRPYRETDASYFFGRDNEVLDLLARTNRSLLTLLYGRAGLGKTSLICAGFAPRLASRSFFPVYLRPRALLDERSDPVQGVIRAVAESAKAHNVEATGAFEAPSLWELFHRESFDFWDASNRIVSPVLMFDQFEEVFQVLDEMPSALPRVRTLLDNISELVENRVPARLASMELPASDEYRFDMSNADYRVILSFREDYLPHVRQLRAIVPSVVENHLRLEPLDGEQARQVVCNAGKALVDENAAEHLVQSVAHQAGLRQLLQSGSARENNSTLRGLVVEPAILSVVCFYLNTERQARHQDKIDIGLVKLKKPEDIFDEYYRWASADAGPAVRTFVESALVTSDGQRVLYPVKALEGQDSAVRAGVDKLVSRGVLRREWFGGEERLEVSHDLLLRPITEAQRFAQRAQESRRTRRQLAIAMGLMVMALGGAAYMYNAAQRTQFEMSQRAAALEAAMVATMPDAAKNDMVRILDDVGNARTGDERAKALQALLDISVAHMGNGSGTRALPAFAANYAQLQLDRDSKRSDPSRSLVTKLRQIIAGACEKDFMLPDDQAVLWFEKNGGIPSQCKATP